MADAMADYEKLKPSCVDSGIVYEECSKRREEEFQSLQEAFMILQGKDVLLMVGVAHARKLLSHWLPLMPLLPSPLHSTRRCAVPCF